MPPSETPATFESFQRELTELVDRFDRGYLQFKSPDYNEATLRADFLDPLFRALGWDVGNTKGLIHTEREVDIEVRTATSGRQTRADYVFRSARVERFTCEAKKPAEPLNDKHIFQAKRDAFNRGVPVALLSDFEELKIYIVGSRPHRGEPHVGEFKILGFPQYPLAARELWDLLAYDNVLAGSIDAEIAKLPKRPLKFKDRQGYLIRPDRTRSLDADFLNFLDDARQQLGSDLLKHNDRADLLAGHRLNEAAQRILDRLVFLRICEDRGIDTGELLQSLFDHWYRQQVQPPKLRRPGRQSHLRFGGGTDGSDLVGEDPGAYGGARERTEGSLYREITDHICSLDHRPASHKPYFNGQLFDKHFSEDLVVGDEWLANFILDLTDDDTGYNFADIPVEILGSAYERFLGKVLRPQGRGATIEEKPEVRKAGGVYYTPRYITDYIVEQTIGRQLEGKSPREVEKLRFVDPACGSGSFLIRAYERVMEHHLRWFIAHPDKQKKADCYIDPANNVRLTTALKRRILLNNIYGVDIDAQAVEVTQLSLYLKMLEGENRDTLRTQTELFRGEALLPALDKNIRCFNSLIASDFSLDPAELVRVNAGDWDVQFRDIMKAGGFDAVVGNPPYVRIQTLNESDPMSVEYLGHRYSAARSGNYDLYVVFVERALSLINSSGLFGYIVPHKFFNARYGESLRELIASGRNLREIVHFGDQQIFEGASTYTCLLFLTKLPSGSFRFKMVKDLAAWRTSRIAEEGGIEQEQLARTEWNFVVGRQGNLFERLRRMPVKLGDVATSMFVGLQTSADTVFLFKDSRALSKATAEVFSQELNEWVRIERPLLKRVVRSGQVGRYFADSTALALFPYSVSEGHAELLGAKELRVNYPLGWDYLTRNRSLLEAREKGAFDDSEWYRYGRSQNLGMWEQPKLLVPYMVTELSAYDDQKDEFYFVNVTTGGYGITLDEKFGSYRYLCGLLNSRLLDFFLKKVSTNFRGGYFAANKQFIEQLPIRSINFENRSDLMQHNRLVTLVDKMLTLKPALREADTDAKRHALENALAKTDHDIDQLVYQLYALTPEEIALVEGAGTPASAAEAD